MAILALIHAAIAGFMLFFMAVVPQAAFKTLSAKAVGAFLRVLFPRLFLFGLMLSLAACVAALMVGADWQLAVWQHRQHLGTDRGWGVAGITDGDQFRAAGSGTAEPA